MRRIFLNIAVALVTFAVGTFLGSLSAPLNLRNSPQSIRTVSSAQVASVLYPGYEFKPIEPAIDKYERKTPFCYDRKILPIWRALKRDKEFRERVGYSDESANCSKMLEIKYVDLNSDGAPEILVRGNNFHLCSAVGNCGFWIFGGKGNTLKTLLSSSDYIDISKIGEQVLKSRTNGFSNIVVKGHMDASDTDYNYFRFNGVRYVFYKYMVQTPVSRSSENTKWEIITGKEFERRQKIN